MTRSIDAESGGLRFRLRAATADAHRGLEAIMAIDDRCRSLGSYRDLIACMWGIYEPLEAALARVDFGAQAHALGMADRRKAGWLADDLRALGLGPSALAALPRASRLPRVSDAADAMGVLYVVEGASLGGQVISRELGTRLAITPQTGGRFFASYGPRVGERWRTYVAALERLAASPALAARAEHAAMETFACFTHWLLPRAVVVEGACP